MIEPPTRVPVLALILAAHVVWHRYGAARRHFAPGGLAGYTHDFIIGGSNWEGGTGWRTGSEAAAWAKAGFNVVSLPSRNVSVLAASLGHATAFGMFAVAHSPSNPGSDGALSASRARLLCSSFSCHPSLMGLVVSSNASAAAASVAEAVNTMRTDGYWLVPFVTSAPSVAAAIELASVEVPLAAVALPTAPSPATRPPSGVASVVAPSVTTSIAASADAASTQWANAVLAQLAAHAIAAANATAAPFTMAVKLDACKLPAAETFLRFATYASVLWGAQALWWEGVGACAPHGSRAFKLLAAVNTRLAQWVGPLFLRPRSYRPAPWAVVDVTSTSSLALPLLSGFVARRPGTRPIDTVQAMEEEMVAVVLANATVGAPETYRGAQRLLLLFSTQLGASQGLGGGGEPGQEHGARSIRLRLRSDATSVRPVEPDAYQGFADLPGSANPPPGLPPTFDGVQSCSLSWVGNELTGLRMPGGGTQLLTYTLAEDWAEEAAEPEVESDVSPWVGRSRPRRVSEPS